MARAKLTGDTSRVIVDRAEFVRAALFPERVDLVAVFRQGEDQRSIDLSALADDIEVEFVAAAGASASYRGIGGLIEGWRDWLEPWTSYEVVPEEQIEVGEQVVVLATLSGQTKHDRVTIEQPAAVVVSVEGDKISRLEFHLDREQALESARR